jgi:glycerol-3-phosphate cytidylyltransferase
MKIGFNCSSFDLFHAGHVTMLRIEKEMCDYLKVALQVDPTVDRFGIKNKPSQSIYERYVQLQACKYVDEILVYETEADLLNLIQTQSINIRFLSEEYENRDFTGKQYCIDHGIEIYYHLRRHNYSSTELRNRIYLLEKQKRELKEGESPIPPHSLELLDKYSIQNELINSKIEKVDKPPLWHPV